MLRTRADRLAVVLIALAGLNVGVLDQVGQGLVADVEAKYEELGADWIVLRYNYAPDAPPIDPVGLRDDILDIPGVDEAVIQFQSSQFMPGDAQQGGAGGNVFVAIRATEFILVGAGVDLLGHPYLYNLFEDQTEGTAFYRNELLWIEGSPPDAPLEAALPLEFATQRGLRAGDAFTVPWNAPLSFGGGPVNHTGPNFTFQVSGIYQPVPTGNLGEDAQRILVMPDTALLAEVTGAGSTGLPNRLTLLVRSDLDGLADTIAALKRICADQGLELDAPGYLGGFVRRSGTLGARAVTIETNDTTTTNTSSPDPSPSSLPPANGTQGNAPPALWAGGDAPAQPDVELFANADLIQSAFAAAQRAGNWFRFLAAGSLILAAIGIGSIVRAEARRLARRVGVQQAVGFTAERLLLGWAGRSILVASVGAAFALALVVLAPYAGLDRLLFGMELRTGMTTILLVPLLAIGLFLGAGLPYILALVRRPPSANLREVDGR